MNALLTALVNDVYTLTNRPDLEAETVLAVRSATLKVHHSDYYYKDLFETGVQFDVSAAQQSIDYRLLVPKWRALKYLRVYDNSQTPGVPGKFLGIVTPDSVLDSYQVNKENVCYIAGTELQIRTLTAQQYFLLGCYIHPDVTVDGYTSWAALEYPFAIVYEASAIVSKAIGNLDDANSFRNSAQDELLVVRTNSIIIDGY